MDAEIAEEIVEEIVVDDGARDTSQEGAPEGAQDNMQGRVEEPGRGLVVQPLAPTATDEGAPGDAEVPAAGAAQTPVCTPTTKPGSPASGKRPPLAPRGSLLADLHQQLAILDQTEYEDNGSESEESHTEPWDGADDSSTGAPPAAPWQVGGPPPRPSAAPTPAEALGPAPALGPTISDPLESPRSYRSATTPIHMDHLDFTPFWPEGDPAPPSHSGSPTRPPPNAVDAALEAHVPAYLVQLQLGHRPPGDPPIPHDPDPLGRCACAECLQCRPHPGDWADAGWPAPAPAPHHRPDSAPHPGPHYRPASAAPFATQHPDSFYSAHGWHSPAGLRPSSALLPIAHQPHRQPPPYSPALSLDSAFGPRQPSSCTVPQYAGPGSSPTTGQSKASDNGFAVPSGHSSAGVQGRTPDNGFASGPKDEKAKQQRKEQVSMCRVRALGLARDAGKGGEEGG